jgi:hypothetical protein
MDERLEYPLPELSVSTVNIIIETKDRLEGRLQIKNTGGAVLSGRIVCRAAYLSFEPATWEGNDVYITYRFNPEISGLKPGESADTFAYVCSNGGEIKLDITVKLIEMAITTDEGMVIANIYDFYEYALANPMGARRLFVSSDFYMLLLATGYSYMEAYEILHRDTHRERAMDNFLILSGLKQMTEFTILNPSLEYIRKPHENNILQGYFLVQKSDKGFVEAPITAKGNAPWINLPAHRLISADFNEANAAKVSFTIDPNKIEGRYARETVLVGADEVDVVFKRTKPLTIRLNREAFRFEDKGAIEITNHTGDEIWAEVFCKDSFVRFKAKKFPVGEAYEIPFDIKLSAFMSAQLLFRKLPFLRSVIEVKVLYRDQLIKKQLDLMVGKLVL